MSDPTRSGVRENACDPVSIDAVAAVIRTVPHERTEEAWDPWEDGWISRRVVGRTAEDIARALAEAGWLRTAEDRAVLDVFNEYAAAIRFTDDQGMTDPVRTSRAVDALYKLAYARGQVAAGGTVPADERAVLNAADAWEAARSVRDLKAIPANYDREYRAINQLGIVVRRWRAGVETEETPT